MADLGSVSENSADLGAGHVAAGAEVARPLLAIPGAALDAAGGMHGWHATVAWSHVAQRTTWRLQKPAGAREVRYLKVYAHSPENDVASLMDEKVRLEWAFGRLPVPRPLAYGVHATCEWLLTEGIEGASAVERELRAHPARLVPLLAQALRRLHRVEWRDCPFDARLDIALSSIRERLEDGSADPSWIFAAHGGRTAAGALAFLERSRPGGADSSGGEDVVLTHGDYCVPNVLIRDWQVAGYVDLGALAVADRWRDIAIALWSVQQNMGPVWDDLFLDSYGIAPDPEKRAYYHLLYDMSS